MRTRARGFLPLAAAFAALCLGALGASSVQAQIPIPLQEQIETFNTLPAAQQQSLIRELQSSLPPAQRDAILSQLTQQRANGEAGEAQGVQTPQQLDTAFPPQLMFPPEPERLGDGSTLVIEFALVDPLPEDVDEARAEEMLRRFAEGNPYELDSRGRLLLPGVPAIALAGLDEEQATVRVEAEPTLRAFDVTLTHLTLDPVGTDALEPFGYDLFSGLASRFAASNAIPVPADYVIGPGDTVNIQLFGSQNQEYFLPVSREGRISFPQIGPITVSGLTLTELRNTINERVTEQMIGVRASTTLGELRSVQVAVLGDVERPGAYTVSGMATITSALYASGGVKEIGSLRDVRLMRDGENVATLDLYDLLLRGDTSGDVRVEAGDAVFVPSVGPTVALDGEVRRPAIYEIRDETSLNELIELAGGFTADANRASIKVERVVAGRGRTIEEVDLGGADAAMDASVSNGDTIRVEPNLEQFDGAVRLAGNVFRPGRYQWQEGMTLSDLLPSPELVKPMSDLNYVLIRREGEPNVDVSAISADLEAIWAGRPGTLDPELRPRDSVTVFNLDVGREHVVRPLLAELSAQAPAKAPVPTVTVDGQVRASGNYPLEPGMRVSDLLRAGGGMTPSAYTRGAELTRYEVVNGEYRETDLVTVDLEAALRGDAGSNVLLEPYDRLTVKEIPRWREQQSIRLVGEVRFPGSYSIRQGETLSSVLERAGGLTDLAFPRGSVFTREELREREAERLESLARRIETELAADALSDAAAGDVISTGQTLVNQLRNTEAVGRLVIDLEAVAAGNAAADVVLRDGDQLFIPQTTQEVMVLGEVQHPTSHLYSARLDRDDYIDRSGGMTSRADRRRVYIVRANGRVVTDDGRRWFSRSRGPGIEPGDTVVVPLDTDRVRPLAAWESVTQVLYNIAVAFSVIDRI